MKMDPIRYALQMETHRFGPGMHPWFGFPLIGIALTVALVAALIYLAWRVGAYYDAAKKKL